jgi:methanol--5-hydroxybenzimidazolylcobamide Co-methyltransferase
MLKQKYDKLAIENPDELIYAKAPKLVKTRLGVEVGAGKLIPELNFTLPTMAVNETTIKAAEKIYADMVDGVLKRCVDLEQEQVIIEYETTPEFTNEPQWGADVVKIIVDGLNDYNAKYGLKGALRATPNDMREMNRPPIMRSGSKYWDGMLKLFDDCKNLEADFLSIESTGGKELNDEALVEADIEKVIFAMGVCACTDMEYLWTNMIKACGDKMIPSGDSSCGYGNTAMVLADKGFIPKTFAAVVRAACVPRTLIPYTLGAYGPSKDCEYAGGFVKAITGCVIAKEGRMASGAHLSPLGNIAIYDADMWSNESIQQIRLLSDMAPTVGMEQLIYDCRQMDTARAKGFDLEMRNIMIESDASKDVMAYILTPEVVINISKEIIKSDDPFIQTKIACQAAIKELREGIAAGKVACPDRDAAYLDIMEDQIGDIPDDPAKFYDEIKDDLDDTKYRPEEYLLG